MKMLLISSNEVLGLGLKMVGIDKVILENEADFSDVFLSAYSNKDIGIILLGKELASKHKNLIHERQIKGNTPLLVEI